MAVTTFKNIRDNKSGTLLTAITATQTTLTLNTGQGASFPAAPFYISCDYEVLLCTAKVGDIFTVTRGVDNTIAAIHAAGSLVEMRSVAALWNDLAAAINAIEAGTNPASQASTVANGSIVDASIAANALIALSKLARYPFTNADLASDVPRANLLVNPGFENWQRGNGPFVQTNTFTADRWQNQPTGSSTCSISRITSTIGTKGYSAQYTYTHVAGGNYQSYNLLKTMAGEYSQLLGKTISMSIRVKSSVVGTVRASVYADGTGATSTNSAYNVGIGEEVLTVTKTIPTDATLITVGIMMDVASATVEVNDAMCVIGSVPVDYQPLTPADDLARCQRYYQRWNQSSLNQTLDATIGQCTATTQAILVVIPVGRLGGSPTLTSSAVSDWGLLNANGASVACTSFSINGSFSDGRLGIIANVASGLVAGNSTRFINIANANAWLAFEWNP